MMTSSQRTMKDARDIHGRQSPMKRGMMILAGWLSAFHIRMSLWLEEKVDGKPRTKKEGNNIPPNEPFFKNGKA